MDTTAKPNELKQPNRKILKEMVYHWDKNKTEHITQATIKLAIVADQIKTEEITNWVKHLAQLLDYDTIEKGQIPDYSYRKLPKVKIDNKSYGFRKKTEVKKSN